MNFLPPFLKNPWSQFILIFLLNLFFRCYHIGAHSFWFDEMTWINIGNYDVSKILAFCEKEDPNPPLFPIILHYWMNVFGDSEFSIRFIPALAGSFACRLAN